MGKGGGSAEGGGQGVRMSGGDEQGETECGAGRHDPPTKGTLYTRVTPVIDVLAWSAYTEERRVATSEDADVGWAALARMLRGRLGRPRVRHAAQSQAIQRQRSVGLTSQPTTRPTSTATSRHGQSIECATKGNPSSVITHYHHGCSAVFGSPACSHQARTALKVSPQPCTAASLRYRTFCNTHVHSAAVTHSVLKGARQTSWVASSPTAPHPWHHHPHR